jgi:hypothetical protein
MENLSMCFVINFRKGNGGLWLISAVKCGVDRGGFIIVFEKCKRVFLAEERAKLEFYCVIIWLLLLLVKVDILACAC